MSSESELSDASSVEYDEQPQGTMKRKVRSPEVYAIKDALKQPRTATYATDWLAKQMKNGDIKVDPEYQRSIVWSDSKQIKLIESILRNLYVPPILFSVTEDDNGNQTRVCIDGKQRLTSIRRFLDGLIPHKDGKMSYYFKQADSTKSVRLLPEALRKNFRNKPLVCVEYTDLSAAHEREMFQRVQLGMALTTGEQMQSFDGPMAQFIHRMHTQLFEAAQIDKSISLATDRGRGFQNLVQIVACIARLPDYIHVTQIQQTRLLEGQGISPDKAKEVQSKSEHALRILQDITCEAELCDAAFSLPPKATRISPVEFCFSALLIAMRMDEPGIRKNDLAKAIGEMRASVRLQFTDMRSNNRVSMAFWDYLTKPPQGLSQSSSSQAGPSQAGPSQQRFTSTPSAKKPRSNFPLTPQTPVRGPPAHHSGVVQMPTTLKKYSKSTPRSQSSAQFHSIFGNTSLDNNAAQLPPIAVLEDTQQVEPSRTP